MLVPMLEHQFSEYEPAYLRAGAAGLITSLLSLWIEQGKKETPSQLFETHMTELPFGPVHGEEGVRLQFGNRGPDT